ncbi:hypothetical protein NFI95_16470 [Acetobacteraceae bacterium KSS8]|uniref:Lipoprotein n=1 Tax=Endosaccharibacter trunci TaxID=2812733 RepID=A0ABT1WE19_9PROT|nr:hypothetical protein [Acetobacteraceae bacterium KSS8]
MKSALLLALLLCGCTSAPPGAGHARATADELDPSGRPSGGPAVIATSPPGDNGMPRLSCRPEGVGTRCAR